MTSPRERTMPVGSTQTTMTELPTDSAVRRRRLRSVTNTTLTGTISMTHKLLRCLVLRSAAQRSGGERSFYAPRRRAPPEGREGVSFSVWAHSDITKSDHNYPIPHTKERTPVVHLTLAYLTHSDRVTEVARGANARPGRSPKTNRDRRRRLRKHRRSSRVAAIVNDASFLFCGRTGFGGFEFSLFKRCMGA